MATVKNKNTKPEIQVRKALFKKGIRYRINDKNLPGSPDLVIQKHKSVIFVHGCYWHGHDNCSKGIKPETNKEFWQVKIQKNKQRDKRAQEELKAKGWTVLVIWGCQLKNQSVFGETIGRIINELKINE